MPNSASWSEGQITGFFFVHLPGNNKKITYQNHKITKKSHTQSTKNHKSLKNYGKITRKSLQKSIKSLKNHRRRSCDFKIIKFTYAILRSDLPLELEHLADQRGENRFSRIDKGKVGRKGRIVSVDCMKTVGL